AVSTSTDPVSVVVPELEALPALPRIVEAPAAPARPAPDGAARAPLPRPSLWLGAIGAAAVVTGVVFAVKTRMEDNTARTLCTGGIVRASCQDDDELARHAQLESAARRDRAIATVAGGVGAASVVAAG